MICLSRPYPFKPFKGSYPQILLDPILNILSRPYPFKLFKGSLSQILLGPILNPIETNETIKLRSKRHPAYNNFSYFKYLLT